jgi:outer membrane protein assembly factor BamB
MHVSATMPGCVAVLATVFSFSVLGANARAQWPQWGGPSRDFTVDTQGLADQWPEDGPRRLWHRPLGSGFSAIVVDDGMLFTMYRKDKKDAYEYTIALDAATGKNVWQKRHLAAVPQETPDYGKDFSGPNATPLVVGDRLFTIGRNANLRCFQKTNGTILWEQDLRKDFGAQLEPCGYSPSPLAYDKMIIVPLGRQGDDAPEGGSLVAFAQATGQVVWKSQTFKICHSSPLLIERDGQAQVVLCTTEGVIGVDPGDGKLLWRQAIPAQEFGGVMATPVWNGKDMLQCSSSQKGYGIRLIGSGDSTSVSVAWSSPKVPLGMGTPVRIGDMIVGAKRVTGATIRPLLGVDVDTGKRLWLDRTFSMPVPIGDAGKLILLDADGKLSLVTATREGLTIHSRCQLTEQYSFTAPTLAGTTLYVRDEKHIMALDLSAAANKGSEDS